MKYMCQVLEGYVGAMTFESMIVIELSLVKSEERGQREINCLWWVGKTQVSSNWLCLCQETKWAC